MLEKPLGSLGLGGTTINVMMGNVIGIRIVSKNIYLDISIVGNMQVSSKGLGGTTINVMMGNVIGIGIVSKNIYVDISIVGNMQVSSKVSR